MTDEEIIQGILEGCSLRTFMVPDPSMLSNYPEHMESYDLPHVIIKGNKFWGKSERGHLALLSGDVPPIVNAFCYTNLGEIFCAYAPGDGRVGMMLKDRYKVHEWNLVRNYKRIWDSDGDQPAEVVASEIEACAKFKIAMLDSEGIWNVHPVDLPMYEKESGQFQLKTVWDSYPLFFRILILPDDTKNHVTKREHMLTLNPDIFECFYSVFPDGTYFNFYDIPRNTRQKYERLLFFSDNL